MAAPSRPFVIDLSQQPWQALYQAAEVAVRKKNWIAAVPLLQQVLLQVPDHASAHHLLGKVLRAKDQLDAALDAQQRSGGSKWVGIGLLRENCCSSWRRWSEAVEAFEQAQAVLPAETDLRQLSTALLQHCCSERSQMASAR